MGCTITDKVHLQFRRICNLHVSPNILLLAIMFKLSLEPESLQPLDHIYFVLLRVLHLVLHIPLFEGLARAYVSVNSRHEHFTNCTCKEVFATQPGGPQLNSAVLAASWLPLVMD